MFKNVTKSRRAYLSGWVGGVSGAPLPACLCPQTLSGQQLQAAAVHRRGQTELAQLKVLVEEQLGTPRPPRLPSWSAGGVGTLRRPPPPKIENPAATSMPSLPGMPSMPGIPTLTTAPGSSVPRLT